jgi:hypothetical protein
VKTFFALLLVMSVALPVFAKPKRVVASATSGAPWYFQTLIPNTASGFQPGKPLGPDWVTISSIPYPSKHDCKCALLWFGYTTPGSCYLDLATGCEPSGFPADQMNAVAGMGKWGDVPDMCMFAGPQGTTWVHLPQNAAEWDQYNCSGH